IHEHMPKAHQRHAEWSPSRIENWAGTIGPKTEELVRTIMAERRHPEQGFRSCMGIIRLAKKHGPERLEAASTRALAIRARSYRQLESILRHGLDRVPLVEETTTQPASDHENIRGRNYYN